MGIYFPQFGDQPSLSFYCGPFKQPHQANGHDEQRSDDVGRDLEWVDNQRESTRMYVQVPKRRCPYDHHYVRGRLQQRPH